MSKFFKALQQADHDRALGRRSRPDPADIPPAPAEDAPAGKPVVAWREPAPPTDVDEHLVSLMAPAAFEAEQYRALRHIVEQLGGESDIKVIAVSSPCVGDGKTVTAVNLAGALAQSPDARVLLIDADLRRPMLGRILGCADIPGEGLVGAIVDPRLTLDRVARPRPPFNLSVICAGHAPPSPYEILKSPRLGDLIAEARHRYDYIIVDTPPLTPVQDCRVIGHWVDGFLVVVAAHRTPRRLLADALTTLDRTKVLGIVFNQDDRPMSTYYSGYHRLDGDPHRPAPPGTPSGVLRRVARTVGASLRGGPRRTSASPAGRSEAGRP